MHKCPGVHVGLAEQSSRVHTGVLSRLHVHVLHSTCSDWSAIRLLASDWSDIRLLASDWPVSHLPSAARSTRAPGSRTRGGAEAIEALASPVSAIRPRGHGAPSLAQTSPRALIIDHTWRMKI